MDLPDVETVFLLSVVSCSSSAHTRRFMQDPSSRPPYILFVFSSIMVLAGKLSTLSTVTSRLRRRPLATYTA
ncbi:hypothetical protein C8F01DRAFT_1242437 [Mycena amicta]|nr:hypothetical protein C8F01DRAFT_1242437 [Mycena amicta]